MSNHTLEMMKFDSQQTLQCLHVDGVTYRYYSLRAAEARGLAGISRLPYSLKVLLENAIRQHAEGRGDAAHIWALVQWLGRRSNAREIGFRPARVLMPDSSGIPFLGDMAAMRDATARLNGPATRIHPVVPVDFIVDHSVVVDAHGTPSALAHNMQLEFAQNSERYEFLRWASQAFENLRLVPPGNGICHQINLELLARVVWTRNNGDSLLAYPDSIIGMDSHTAMINSLGIVGWGVGGLEGGAAALGEPISILVPEVIGCRVSGRLQPGVTATDAVLTITELMRSRDMVGKFVEYFGPGLDALTLPDRATIANMTPEFGATVSYFPIDAETLRYLRSTQRDEQQVGLVETYARAQGLWRDGTTAIPEYTEMIEVDLASIEPCVAGPRRPQERVPLPRVPEAFNRVFPQVAKAAPPAGTLGNGSVVIAAITSCTNTSNPWVMLAAGLLARNAVARGLKPKPWVKTSLSPGSRVVADYLAASGLQAALNQLGFHVTGYGCMTCMGNSGPLPQAVAQALEAQDLAVVAVLSGNRNFEGRVHASVRANFLASPPLVVAYALAGSIATDLANEPLGNDPHGAPVRLRDIWPSDDEIRKLIDETIGPGIFARNYSSMSAGTAGWQALKSPSGPLFPWNPGSTFIRRPPFFDDMTTASPEFRPIRHARVLAMFGDMLTTDHISPIGTISTKAPAGEYLQSLGVPPGDFVSYAARRLNHDVMVRGTFANVRIRNEMTPGVEGSWTRHMPDGRTMTIFKAAQRYRDEGVPLIVVAGSEYGAGSSRDWAAKGASLLGVRAVLAESFERIHRSNLIGMAVLPMQFAPGVTRKTLALDGSEVFDFPGLGASLAPGATTRCVITRRDGAREDITLTVRLDTDTEADYYRHGGILQYVLRERFLGNA